MQRVSALLPSWDRTKPNAANTKSPAKSKPSLVSLDKVFGWVDRSASARRNSNTPSSPVLASYDREAYWPTSLDKECEKAARILKSFCSDGFLAQENRDSIPSSPTALTTPKFVPKKIPPRIIQNAVGLAIFSCMRSGLWMSGSGGSGILIARKADGTWSPPSGIMLHTAALGFVVGVDIYDCVLVINSVAALEVFMGPRTTLGVDVNLTVGPLVTAGLLENDIRWKHLEGSVLTYLKARGQHQHVPLDGSLVTERGNENKQFYSGDVSVLDILAGNIDKSIPETRPIFEVIKAAEGRTDFDAALMENLSRQPAPGDAIIDTPNVAPLSPPLRSPFGIPAAEDPDPFGVIALEMAGLEIREAGTRLRPASSQFEFNPAPSSPLFGNFGRQSIDTYLSRSNRGSIVSSKSQGTQTDQVITPETVLSRNSSHDGQLEPVVEKLPTVVEPEEVDYTKIDVTSIQHLRRRSSVRAPVQAKPASPESKPSTIDHGSETEAEKKSSNCTEDDHDADADDEDDEDDDSGDEGDETVVYEVATAAAPTRTALLSTQVTQVIHAKGALVTIPKRIPPPLPARSPARTSRASRSEFGDVSSLRSPLRTSFQSSDLVSERAVTPSIEEVSSKDSDTAPVAAPKMEEVEVDATEALETDKDVFTTPSEHLPSVNVSRLSTGSTHAPPTPQIGEATSSGDELDHEPKTPKHEDVTAPQGVSQHDKSDLTGTGSYFPPTPLSNAVALAR